MSFVQHLLSTLFELAAPLLCEVFRSVLTFQFVLSSSPYRISGCVFGLNGFLLFFFLRLSVQNAKHLCLESLLVLLQPVLLPGVV